MKLLLVILAALLAIACAKQATMASLQQSVEKWRSAILDHLKQCASVKDRTNSLEAQNKKLREQLAEVNKISISNGQDASELSVKLKRLEAQILALSNHFGSELSTTTSTAPPTTTSTLAPTTITTTTTTTTTTTMTTTTTTTTKRTIFIYDFRQSSVPNLKVGLLNGQDGWSGGKAVLYSKENGGVIKTGSPWSAGQSVCRSINISMKDVSVGMFEIEGMIYSGGGNKNSLVYLSYKGGSISFGLQSPHSYRAPVLLFVAKGIKKQTRALTFNTWYHVGLEISYRTQGCQASILYKKNNEKTYKKAYTETMTSCPQNFHRITCRFDGISGGGKMKYISYTAS